MVAGLGAGKFLVDMSTVSPAVERALAEKVRDKGADMVDAPVSGSVITLQQGKALRDGRRPQRTLSSASSRCCSILVRK